MVKTDRAYIHRHKYVSLQLVCSLFFTLALSAASFAAPLKILAFGDSLFAGYNLLPDQNYPARLEVALNKAGFDVQIINGAVSGDTAQAGLNRLAWVLSDPPDAVLLELGANDMLRGKDVEQAYQALAAIIEQLQQKKIAVALYGMVADPAMGDDYAQRFNQIYPRLAAHYHIPLYPFFLDGVATEPQLKLSDGMHPNEAGVNVLVARTQGFVETFLRSFLK
jgi:acyl-CoA thioesterase I